MSNPFQVGDLADSVVTGVRVTVGDAIRHPKRGKAHRPVPVRSVFKALDGGVAAAACDPWISAGVRGWTERIPVEQTAPEDRCRRCFPSPSPEE